MEKPPEWFCRHWGHVQRNGWYKAFWEASKKHSNLPQHSIERLSWEGTDTLIARELLQLPKPIDATFTEAEAWKEAKAADADYPDSIKTNVECLDPHLPWFWAVDWNNYFDRGETRAWGMENRRIFNELKMKIEDAEQEGDTEELKKLEPAMRDFLNNHTIVDMIVNTSLPLTTLLREFKKTVRNIQTYRKTFGAKLVDRESVKPNWREQIRVWDVVKRAVPNREPEFTNKLLKKIYPTQINKLNYDRGLGKISQADCKHAMDKLRSKATRAFETADEQIRSKLTKWALVQHTQDAVDWHRRPPYWPSRRYCPPPTARALQDYMREQQRPVTA